MTDSVQKKKKKKKKKKSKHIDPNTLNLKQEWLIALKKKKKKKKKKIQTHRSKHT